MYRHVLSLIVFAAMPTLIAANPVEAQDFRLFGSVGTYSSVRDIDDGGNADFTDGLDLSGGVALDLNEYVSARATVDLVRNEFQERGLTGATGMSGIVEEADIQRLFYGADLQFRYPVGQFAPYVFAGGGAVRVTQPFNGVTFETSSQTKFAGRFGAGLEMALPQNDRASLFAQFTGYAYTLDHLMGATTNEIDFEAKGLKTSQVDGALQLGLSLRMN